MNHLGTKELFTDRLTLRRYEAEDADAVFYNWAQDKTAAHFCSWNICKSAEEALELINGYISQYGNPDYYLWAIELNDLEQPVGTVLIKHLDEAALSAEFECWVGSDFIKKGIAKEAVTEVFRFMTENVGLQRIWGKCAADNDGGAKLMVRLGMEYEGLLKKAVKYDSGIVDATIFGWVYKDSEAEDRAEDTEDNGEDFPIAISTKVVGEDGVVRNHISDETLEYVEILAKLELSEAEKEAAKKDMEEMLDYIDQLNELDTTGIEPMSHVFAVSNAFREDVICNGDGTAHTLKNAPMIKNGGFVVPKTIGE